MEFLDHQQTFPMRVWTFIPQGIPGDVAPRKISAIFPMDENAARAALARKGTPVDGWTARCDDQPVKVGEPVPEGKKLFRVVLTRTSEAEVEVLAADEKEARQEALDSDPDWDDDVSVESVKEIR